MLIHFNRLGEVCTCIAMGRQNKSAMTAVGEPKLSLPVPGSSPRMLEEQALAEQKELRC